ncbi:MAG: Alanine-anticapsin ligase BacD [Syntrophorhabdus sp. PtaU1.Bin002]|nr:MAG: Alanine-anticapsin ligase BacD [Syntrophorhabdus sp. PtaU1.Bin002]
MLHYIFIESNTTGTGRLAIERLRSAGHRVSFVTKQPSKYPFLSTIPGIKIVETNTNDLEQLINVFELSLKSSHPDALITFSTYYVLTVAVLAKKFGFRYLNPLAAHSCHEKNVMRNVLKAAGMPGPQFWLIGSEEDASRVAREVDFPCVVKPVSESGSLGVSLIQNSADLIKHFRMLAARPLNERGQETSGAILVEEFLSGPEFSIETVTLEPGQTVVVGITEKHLSEPPYFVEIGHDFPAKIGEGVKQSLEKAAMAALQAVGYDYGPAHIEIRLTDGGPVVVEINPRLAGGMIPELVRYAIGVDLIGAVLDLVVGREPILEASPEGYSSIRFFTAKKPGFIKMFHSLEWARQIPLVQELTILRPHGEIRPAESSNDRLGYVITSGKDRHAVISTADMVMNQVQFDFVGSDEVTSPERCIVDRNDN